MNNICKILTVILFLTIITSCKKDSPLPPSCGQKFYYYNNQKIFLFVSKLKLTIGFKDTLTFEEMKHITDQYSFIKTLQQDQTVPDRNRAFPDINENLSCEELQTDITNLKDNPSVIYVNPFLVNKEGNDFMGVSDEFAVCLYDTSQLTELQNMAQQTHTTILRQNDFDPLVYILSATKYSNGDALEMANYFYETQEFKFSEPNFFLLNLFE